MVALAQRAYVRARFSANYEKHMDAFLRDANAGHMQADEITYFADEAKLCAFLDEHIQGNNQEHRIAIVNAYRGHRQAVSFMKAPGDRNTMLIVDAQRFGHDIRNASDLYSGLAQNMWERVISQRANTKGLMIALGTQEGFHTDGDHALAIAKTLRRFSKSLATIHHKHITREPFPLQSSASLKLLSDASPSLLANLLVHHELLSELKQKSVALEVDQIALNDNRDTLGDVVSARKAQGPYNTSIYEERARLLSRTEPAGKKP